MQLSPLSWQSLTVQYTFAESDQPTQFFDFQPNAMQALNQFVAAEMGALLVLKSEVLPEFLSEIVHFFSAKQAKSILMSEFSYTELCGYRLYLAKEQRIETILGAIQQAENGILIVNLNDLFAHLSQWDKLKHALLFGQYQPYAQNALPSALPPLKARFKLLLVGSREQIAELEEYDSTLFQFARYAEVNNYIVLEDHCQKWANYVQNMAKRELGKSLGSRALNQLLKHAMRQSESQRLIALSPTQLKHQLYGIASFYPKVTAYSDIQAYLDSLEMQAATLHHYTLQDMLNGEIYVDTEGDEIGQINGLSVVEFDGVPYAFGEPLRITCNVQYGDGEIHDIERKVELGGNIHAKGIFIAQSCLTNLLELPTQLPFSATLAFEQSYGEIDGDSSSLAIFCALISSLAKLPIPQSIAVTGAIDQLGNVLSVGGVNQKIEGFFDLCAKRGLNGKQGVIIPSTCQSHLSLKSDVVSAVKAQQFSIWIVDDVFDAMMLLFEHPFFAEDLEANSEKMALFDLIHQNLESQGGLTSSSIWQKIRKWF